MKKIFKNIVYILISIVLVLLVNYDFGFKLNSFSFILGLFFYLLLKSFKTKKVSKLVLLNAFIFSMFIEVGVCYQKSTTIKYLWNNLPLTFLNIIGFTIIFYLLISLIFKRLSKLNYDKPKSKLLNLIFYKHPFLSPFIITLSMSIFYLIFFYPGSMAYDGMWQLSFYYHPETFSDHHPALLTLIMGNLMDLGRHILNANLGMFLFILPQIIVNALVYSYVLKIMHKLNTPVSIRIISLIFYSMFPLLVMNSITYIKDTIFYLIFLFLFVYLYYHFKVNYQKEYKIKYLVIALLYLSLYLTRNNGFYIALITSLVFIIYNIKKDKSISKYFTILTVFLLSINYIYHDVFLVKMHIAPASIREMMSVPLQQTARYLKYYSSDLSKKDRKTLSNLFTTNLTEVGKLYYPNKSDNVKWVFKEYPTNKDLKEYLSTWTSMFLDHPLVYVDATLNNIYGYFYPNVMNFVGEEIGFYYIYVKGPVNDNTLDLHWNNLDKGRDFLENIALKISTTKVTRELYTPAFYMLIFISLCFYLLKYRKGEVFIYFTPLFMVVLSCIISPVNAHMRYLQPVMVCIPFVLAIIIEETKKKKSRTVK